MCAGAVRLVISTIFITALLNYTSSSPQSVEQLNYKNNSRRNEERLDPNDYFKVRSEAVQALKDRQEHPYPHKFAVTTRFLDFAEAYNDISSGQVLDNVTVSVAGRVYSIRENRRKVVWDIVSEGIKIQITTNAKTYESESFTPDTEKLRKGDIIGCIGHPGKTSKGKLVIVATSIKLLAPSLRALPHSIDNDTRSRKRYLDLILNERVRQTFITRAKIISYIRRFLENMGFLEIETPLLNLIPGGAVAKPFLTHHDMLDQDLYLRISPELYHKKLVVGGLERVYEIGKQFRNEEIDVTHNPEFTTCEFYMAYADYNDLMTITETLLSGMVKSIFGSYKIKYHPYGAKGEERQIDFTPPFARVPMMATLERVLNVTLPLATELDTPEANSQLTQIFLTLGLAFPEPRSTTKLLDRLVYRFLESKLYNPTFILDHPQIMSPLAKEHRVTPGLTERFELYVMQKEISNAYTEQNDPVAQRKRLEKEAESRAAGDEEIPPTDEDFLTALEYGLPPTAGLGLGIDRLTMILTDITDIKDVLLFPAVNDKVEELPSLSKVPLIF